MRNRCRNMVNLSEQSLPKPILYTVLDILIRLIDNEYMSKPCFINHCYHMCGNKYYLYLLTHFIRNTILVVVTLFIQNTILV